MPDVTTTEPGTTGATEVIRVLLVDDHEVLAASLAQVLDLQPDLASVGIAGTLAEARAMVQTTTPDLVLLDQRLPDGDGVSAIAELRRLRPGVKVVVLTASTADRVIVEAVNAGASGFISKTGGLSELTEALRAVARDEAVISPELLARLLPRLQRGSAGASDRLTQRELDVLELVAEGLTNAAIAERMVVSVHTVRNHIANLSAKLGAHSKLEALSIAIREGMLPGR